MTRLEKMRKALDEYLEAKQILDAPLPSTEDEYHTRQSNYYHAEVILHGMMTPKTFEQLIVVAEAAEKEVLERATYDSLAEALMPLEEEG